jgi:chromatin segregation and condensation protein Rec8/ScpA/Scc1 (kleisin family)
MQSLLSRIEVSVSSGTMQSFNVIAGGKNASKQDVLVNFLALLELMKDGVLLAEQGNRYGDILISR